MFYSQQEEQQHPCFDRQPPCFIFHYALLNSEEEAELFQNFPLHMLFYFLQWPLSLTFLDNLERLWNLIPFICKQAVFRDLFEILFSENILRQSASKGLYSALQFRTIPGMYMSEHLVRIWVALWSISLDSSKSHVLDFYVFMSIQYAREQLECRVNFLTSRLKEKLLPLFLSNGEAILELYEREDIKESLRVVVAKYIPEHFEVLDRQFISFLATLKETERKITPRYGNSEKNKTGPVHASFLNCIQKFLFSSNRS
ncbi:hypothetical protein AVEN_29792-1 [Araneus ventricosus]|uniref:Uncharacterized protein n=1 Tax=Araneus ventricosus TaxID=182803 RepID=A0A4Y2VL76_ARAVE|nr:hypothetical protein AVEN_29792-1 [Araneus ventricosus]